MPPKHVFATDCIILTLWTHQFLCMLGADLNDTDVGKRTALHWAAQYGRSRVCITMMHGGRSLLVGSYHPVNLLCTCLQAVEVLLRMNANINAQDTNLWTVSMHMSNYMTFNHHWERYIHPDT